jgi:hypothetical protein
MHFSKEEKAMRVEDWRRSGKTAWAYAKENGISPQTFTTWTKLKTESPSCFIEVPAQAIPALGHDGREMLIEKGDMRIHIPLAVGGGELRTIFGALGGAV